jgi:hypothetical protein
MILDERWIENILSNVREASPALATEIEESFKSLAQGNLGESPMTRSELEIEARKLLDILERERNGDET